MASLSEKDCLEIIGQKLGSSDYEFVGFNLEPLGEISGFLGEHSRLKISVKCAAPGGITELSFFVKSMSVSESLKEFTVESGAFIKEERMFAEIVPLLLRNGVSTILDCTPRCYLIRPSERLVFDDLTAEGYRVLDHRKPLSLNELEVVVKALAKFHAGGIILEDKLAPYRLLDDHQKEFTEAFFQRRGRLGAGFLRCVSNAATLAVDLVGVEDPGGFKEFIEDVIGRFPELARPSAKHRNAICHGDLWAANIMCKFEGDEAVHCKLVDFQFYRYAPPASDLTAVLHLTTDREFRNAHGRHFVEYYYAQLKNVLGENRVDAEGVVPYEDFLESCALYRVFGAALSLVYFQLIMVPAQELDALFGEPEKLRRLVLEDRSELLPAMCGKYPAYRRRLLEAVLDLKDLYINDREKINPFFE